MAPKKQKPTKKTSLVSLLKQKGLRESFSFEKVGLIFILCILGLNVSAQTQLQTDIKNTTVKTGTLKIGMYDWFVAKTQTVAGIDYALLVTKQRVAGPSEFSYASPVSNNYSVSKLRDVINYEYDHYAHVTAYYGDLGSIAVVPDLNLSQPTSTTALSVPTATLAQGSGKQDIFFALSQGDVNSWLGNTGITLVSPITGSEGYPFRWWLRTASTIANNALVVNPAGGAIVNANVATLSTDYVVIGVWARTSPLNYSISGALVAGSGTPSVGGKTIEYIIDGNPNTVVTDGAGNYTIPNIPGGKTVTINPPAIDGYSVSPTTAQVTVSDNVTGQNFTYTKKLYTISGTVNGLPNNAGITIYYTVDGGSLQSVITTTGGAYTIPNIPHGSNVVITPSPQTGYKAVVSSTPSTNNVTQDIPGKTITYFVPGFTVSGENYLAMKGKSYCNTFSFTLNANPNTPTDDLFWILNGTEIAGSRYQSTVYLNNLPKGFYTLSMTVLAETYTTQFAVGEIAVLWTPEANISGTKPEKQIWNIAANWTPAVVPSECNDVYIPGNLNYYPILTSPVACRDIYFIYDSELGRPDLLTYRRAYVHMNFGLLQTPQITNRGNDKTLVLNDGSTTADRMLFSASVSGALIKRERWNMLSSPLKDVVTGDYSFGGFPLSFLMKFDPVKRDEQTYSVGNWTTRYTSMTEPVAPAATNGFAFYMYGYGMTGNNSGCEESRTCNYSLYNDLPFRSGSYGLKETNGILELPFFADSTDLYAHRTQTYLAPNTSRFYYIYDSGPDFNKLTGHNETFARSNDNYRFAPEKSGVFENLIYHPVTGFEDGTIFLAGNPYMSSIDVFEFFKDNLSSLYSEFRLWNGSTFDSYQVNTVTNTIISGPTDQKYLSPFQGFFLAYKGGAVKFDVTKISTVRPRAPVLYDVPKRPTDRPTGTEFTFKSANETTEENLLRIKAENDLSVSYALIGYREGASKEFVHGKDVQKLFSPYDYVCEVYSLANEIPADINFINSGETVVPLGIKTGQTGGVRLTFTGMDKYFKASKIEFFDALENRTIDLTGQSSYTYTFNNTVTGIQNGRFSLRLGNSPTALPEIYGPDDLKVYGDSKGIYVISSPSDPIQQVIVYDFQGRIVYESTSGAGYYSLPEQSGLSPIIVKVVTKNHVKIVKNI